MKKSKYKRKRALHGTVAAKSTTEKVKETAIQTGKDLLIGVIGGGIAGAVIGKSSLLIGLGVTGYGHYSKKPTLTTFGIGMMAASGFNSGINGTQGIDGFSANDIKARVMSFKDSISSKLFLDKIMKKKESKTEGMDGIGSVQYLSATDELDFSALNRLENQIQKSGSDFQKTIQGTGEVHTPVTEIPEFFEGGLEELDFTSTSY